MQSKLINKYFILSATLIFSLVFNAWGIPSINKLIVKKYADGSTMSYYVRGDEHKSYYADSEGRLLMENSRGEMEYSYLDENHKMISYQVKALDLPFRTEKEIRLLDSIQPINPAQIFSQTSSIQRVASSVDGEAVAKFPLTGSPKTLVILAAFSDRPFSVASPKEAFSKILNSPGYSENGATGSAFDYFKTSSSGAFTPVFDVVGPFTLPSATAFYGADDAYGTIDVKAQQMVKDACRLAFESGVKFNNYDYDADGYVDNIFIYYSGFNQAEGASTNTIWPQRNSLPDKLVKYNTKYVYNYSYTSELRLYPDSAMCGIGTFSHEFGHVLGLADLYSTNGSTVHTLNAWDIMDYGAYLNKGRTPPTYSSFERFFLGWLKPTELTWGKSVNVPELSDSNSAYLVSASNNHNLNGASPNPKEYFLLENRQLKGWDSYLPENGLMITKINFDSVKWYANAPNNAEKTMVVDLMEADGIADNNTVSGDLFPQNTLSSYSPVLSDGTVLGKNLTDIQNLDGQVSFKFMGGDNKVQTLENENIELSVADNRIVLKSSDTLPHSYQLMDISGKILQSGTFHTTQHIYTSKGIYILKIDRQNLKVVM